MIHLTLPYPISSSRYWAVRVIPRKPKPLAITYVTEEAKNYKAAVGLLAKAAGIRAPSTGRVGLYIKLFPHRPQDWAKRARKDPNTWDDTVQCIDLGNCEKVLSDALNGIAWVDDKQIRRTLLERMEPDEKGARLEVAIECLAAAPSLFGEAAA
ncbi:RusA family crossover junction endodeoxyribonuclease [Stenotrophomonas maltophilia]|jgi:crossover junction endodeoxyribonuclease RusA|nr:RusA family crossover junction endodeoxyribonuclease [Stenotrophomonas maltophilia]MDP9618009.1 crossover junction endodeoxyribonuclease RusA [Stenotrophomonas maltophilia]RRU08111.1 RusA family crossover junction endodeoxyribonuclease [Stenotrophomonas maltophilia]RRU11398.1 RusA family crossover junction endodeoxyribonuclease [Stenotrophomonas maltophilia]RRU28102.1 RusA family crossover junction endodeoxyribonuclease [Stenotrophomonas maltophilia]